MQNYMLLREHCRYIVVKIQSTVTRLVEDLVQICLFAWLDYSLAFTKKLILPSIFNSVDFWSSMSCFVLDFELAYENFIKVLGVFIDGKFQVYSFWQPKKYKTSKQAFCCSSSLHGIVQNTGFLDYVELPQFLRRDVKVWKLRKRHRKNENFSTV